MHILKLSIGVSRGIPETFMNAKLNISHVITTLINILIMYYSKSNTQLKYV